MKTRQKLSMLAAVAAMSIAGTPQNLPAQNSPLQEKNTRHNDAVERTPTTVRQGKVTALNPAGGHFEYIYPGMSPKEYGQYLQRTGRQKWVKRKK